eukprot:Em0002g1449a
MDDTTHLELGVPIFVGTDKGSSAIGGSLYEVKVCQRTCSAKRLCDVLQEVRGDGASLSDEDVAIVAQRFRRECVSLSKLRHPNVLQFIGVHCRGPLDVVMVIEHVYTDLNQCLRAHPNLDSSVKLSVLFDVSCGLLYLHTRDPPVVHRNLTASNVVLSSDLTAKLADLRMSKVFDLETQVSRLPEGLVYMPPEALSRPPTCDVKLDVFSFGVLCLYVVNEGFATSDEQETPRTPPHTSAPAVEAAKRQCVLERIGVQHPLYPIITQCLQEEASSRPAMGEMNELLQKLSLQNPRKFKDVLKSVVDLESRRNLKSLRTQLEDKKEEIAKLAQRLLIVDIDVCKLEGAKEAVIKNRDKRKAQTLMTAKEHSRVNSENGLQNGHFPVTQFVPDKHRVVEEEKKQLQEMNSDSLRNEVGMCRQELILKTRECDFLRNKVRQLEKVCGQVGVVNEGTTTVQEGVKTGGGRLSKTLSRDRKDEVTREPCDSCVGLRKQLWELQLRLEKYQDECGAYMEQSTEQKRQIQFHADAHYQLVEENDKLKKNLDQELKRMAELLIEFEGQQKEATDACATYQQEKAKRLVLEKRCADMELVNDSLRQENLILFNQNEEMKWKISENNLVETSCTDKTANVLGTHVRNECTTSHLRAPPSHLNTPDHWEASEVLTPSEQEGVALTSDHMMTSSYHGDENQQLEAKLER